MDLRRNKHYSPNVKHTRTLANSIVLSNGVQVVGK